MQGAPFQQVDLLLQAGKKDLDLFPLARPQPVVRCGLPEYGTDVCEEEHRFEKGVDRGFGHQITILICGAGL